nr:MAG TPA: nucleoporin [Caudoviricetes sp.]
MFNKEIIENLEKRISRIEQIQNAECNSAQMERRVQRALIDSNNEVVRRIFDDVSVNSVYGVDVFSPKTGDIRVRNAVFSGEVFKQAAPNGIPDYLKKVEEDKTEAPTIASVLEKARRNTIAIQELLKRTGCSNVNEVISKFELGVSFKKMYDEEARKRKELARQRDLLDRDLRNQIAKLSDKNQSLMQSEKSLICKLADKNEELKRVEELSDGRYKEVVWLRGELKNQEQAVEKLKDENKQLKSVNAKRVESTLDSICREADAIVGYSDLKKKYDKLLSRNKELQAEVLEVLRDKKYLEMANTSLLQETRKIRESLNEKIKKLRQRLKKSSIRYRDLKESISRNGLKSV